MNQSRARSYELRRRPVVAALLAERGDTLVIAGLGAPAWDITAAGDDDLNFPLWGVMGGAVPLGLGLALARPERRILVITGDGEMLMGLGALATVAYQAPANLAIVVLDNESYGETGMQATHTARRTDLAAIAKGAGIETAGTIYDQGDLDAALPAIREAPGPVFHAIKVRAEELDIVAPPRDGVQLKRRFRAALLDTG
ncbi:MAG: thiamine pyrophosphate-dependent enzyme [Alphaproteobacteria bacterium]